MRIYIDTSAIVAFFDFNNAFHQSARHLFSLKGFDYYTGTITLLEIESTLARNWNQLNFESILKIEFQNLSITKKIRFAAEYCLKMLSIEVVSGLTIEKIVINGKETNIENTFHLAWKINAELKLRTLDAIQICSAIKLRIYDRIEIQYFLTNDTEILKIKKEIFQLSRILPISCTELKNILDSDTIT